jgi:Icc protein
MARGEFCFVHFSDLHLLADPQQTQYDVRTGEILERAIPLVNAVGPDLVVVGGDLTSDEKTASYQRARAAFARLTAPTHAIMGNHDDRAVYRSVFHPDAPLSSAPTYRGVHHAGCRFLLLDSHIPGEVEGMMGPEQLAWVDATLTKYPDRSTFCFVHHQPLPIGVKWLDNLGFLNGQDLIRIVARHPQVRAVFFSHVHQPRIWRHLGFTLASVPALAFQFSQTEQETNGRHITHEMPGFRVVRVRGNGRIETAIHSLDGTVVPDPAPDQLPRYGQ